MLLSVISQVIMAAVIIFLTYFVYISVKERELKAAGRIMVFTLLLVSLFFFLIFTDLPLKKYIYLSFDFIFFLALSLLIIPVKGSKLKRKENYTFRFDERNIMFSRNELKPGSERFEKYYSDNPQNRITDDLFREKPGLLSPESAKYDPFMFASSMASFDTVEELAGLVDGPVSEKKTTFDKEALTTYLKEWSRHLGALEVGITELRDYHLYSVSGRRERYDQKVDITHKTAIAFTVEMEYDMVKAGPDAPIVMESAKQYLNAGIIACQLALFLRKLGYSARAHIDGNYLVVCPLVAKDAGLGDIGRMGLLMTDKLGPRVRIGVVTTEIELNRSQIAQNDSVIDFCTICKKCGEVCPSKAISLSDRKEINGSLRWQINQEKCFTYWCTVGTDCGRCVAVCPYSHPNTLLHNLTRWGIKNSFLFRRIALWLDDIIYGRKPSPQEPLPWMKL